MDILKLVQEQEEYMISQRRYLHENPELSGEEEKTIEYLDAELTKLGIDHVVVPRGGILGFIEGAKPGKTVLLRGDVDALPVMENPENLAGPKVSVSKNPGVCHACGHDAHTAMLLTAGRILLANKDQLEGRVVLMFERGEEYAGNVVYLYKYIEENNIHVDSAYGTHVYFQLDSGKVSLLPGPVMSGAMGFKVTITGRGGHGSRPDQSISPIDCFVAVYNAMNAIRMRKVSPFNSLAFSVGRLTAGAAGNVIPDDLVFQGTTRVFELEDGVAFKETLYKILDGVCAAYDCTYVADISGPGMAVKNDPECAAFAQKVIGDVIGADRIENVEPWMASESFSMTLAKWPGVFAFLGIRNPEKGTGAAHHNDNFDLDEDVMKYGAAASIAYAVEYLKSGPDVAGRGFEGSFADMYKLCSRPQKQVDFLEGKRDDAL